MLLLTLLWGSTARAQPIITAPRPTSTNQPDPLAAFMVAQPPIDTESPIIPVVEFEPNVITNGQQSVYRVTLNVMEQSIDWPESIPVPQGCTLRKGASGQFLQNVGGAIVPKTTFLYHLQPQSTGTVTLPAYTVQARGTSVRIPPATLNVLPPGAVSVEHPPSIQLITRGTEFFVGQDIDLLVSFPGKADGTVRTLSQVEVVGDGLIVDRNYRAQRIETVVENGVPRPTFIYNALVTPMQPGRTVVTAYGHTVGTRLQGQIIITGPATLAGGIATYKLVDSDPLELNILPLPRDSELPGFTGAIGFFMADPPKLSTNRVRAGDLITLNLTVRGQGNLQRVLPPQPAEDPRWQVFAPRKDNLLPAVVRQRGFVTFSYQLIPLDDTLEATPAIPFCYLNPDSRRYVDLTVPPVAITVDPAPNGSQVGGQPSLVEARSLLQALTRKPDAPTALADLLTAPGRSAGSLAPLHQRPGFVGVQLIPAGLLAGLWYWDRRRRFFEQHPEVLIRRRARKAIGRQARQARKAARRDQARDFLLHAIRGFQEASAPAAPADPRALVCEDVLSTLPDELRREQTTRMIRKLFTTANDWRFGERQPDRRELLSLAQEVDQQLRELRRRL